MLALDPHFLDAVDGAAGGRNTALEGDVHLGRYANDRNLLREKPALRPCCQFTPLRPAHQGAAARLAGSLTSVSWVSKMGGLAASKSSLAERFSSGEREK